MHERSPNQGPSPADQPAVDAAWQQELRQLAAGLASPLPTIAPRYFYDATGSALFECITETEEYYPTRIETNLLAQHADAIIATAACQQIVELGCGASAKIRLLLDAGRRAGTLRSCAMMDISERPLQRAVAALQADYPELRVRGFVGDFGSDLDAIGAGGHRLWLFLAGTIGNFTRPQATDFLAGIAARMQPSDRFLLGVDLVKDKAALEAAYDDEAGYTARFNRNALRVINRRFDADFVPEQWQHVARYDDQLERIEMRLRANQAIRVRVGALGCSYRFAAGDELLTEISCKYTPASLGNTLIGTGLALQSWWSDQSRQFGLALLAPAPGAAP